MDTILSKLAELMANNAWLAPLIALAAGFAASFTPCCLSAIPLVIGYVGGTAGNNTKKAFWLSVTYVAGSAVTFCVLGVIASLAGKYLSANERIFHLALGVIMCLMALQVWEIYEFIPSSYLSEKNTKKGFGGAFIAGILAGIFASPCSTPVLIVLLAIVADTGKVAYGILLLLLYSVGHGVLSVIAGTSVGFVQKISHDRKYGAFNKVFKVVTGLLVFFIGLYMFYLGF